MKITYLNEQDEKKIKDDFIKVFNMKVNGKYVDDWFDLRGKNYVLYRFPENCLDNDEWYENINNFVNSVIKEDLYIIDLNGRVELKQRNEKTGYFPDGDDYFFVTKNFDYAILTIFLSGNEHYAIFVGDKLVNEVIKHKVELGFLDVIKK